MYWKIFGLRGFPGALAAPALALALAGCGGETRTGEDAEGWIAFVSERDGNPEVYLVRPSGEEERRLTTRPTADYPAAPAPDGSGLLVVSVTEDDTGHYEELLHYPLDGGEPVPIGPRTGRSRAPSWHPGGEWLVFESDEASFRDLYRIGGDGRSPQRLTDDREGNFEPVVSPDGEWIAFASSRDGDAEVYVMRADGTEQRRLTAFHRDDWGAQWSPDGKSLLFLSNREGSDRIFLTRPDGTGQRKLNAAADTGAVRTDMQEADPAWSPDGARIAHTVRFRDGSSRIRVTELATGRVREISDGEGRDMMPAWSPDGRYLAFTSEREGESDLYLARADGTGLTRLTHAPGADWLPRWVGGTTR